MSDKYSVKGLIEQADDIISSGMGDFSEWHRKQLTELFKDVPQKKRKKFVKKYYEGDSAPEGCTSEELQFMSNMLNVMIKVEVMPEEEY